jgi:hypothetical protein
MIDRAHEFLTDAAVFSGELKRDLIAAGVVILIAFGVWAVQTFLERAR